MKTVDIRSLKRIAKNFPVDAPIRVILSEPDELPYIEYAYKCMVWLKLLPELGMNR